MRDRELVSFSLGQRLGPPAQIGPALLDFGQRIRMSNLGCNRVFGLKT